MLKHLNLLLHPNPVLFMAPEILAWAWRTNVDITVIMREGEGSI